MIKMIGKTGYLTALAGFNLTIAVLSQPVFAQNNPPERLRLRREPVATTTTVPSTQIEAAIPDLNKGVLDFALQHMGKKVGNGECWTLAAEALESAGAQYPQGFTFGRELKANETWLPGDIIQFTKCRFEENDGRHTWYMVGTPNHTAIIQSSSNNNKQITVIHQNVNNVRKVQVQNLDFNNMVKGRYSVYRPLPKPQTDRQNGFRHNVQHEHRHEHHHSQRRLYALLQLPVTDGPYFQERAKIQEKIRALTAKGANVFFYLQRYKDIELMASNANFAPEKSSDNNLLVSINTLTQLLTVRESLLDRGSKEVPVTQESENTENVQP